MIKKRSVTKFIAFPDISQQYKTGSVHLWVQTSQSVRGVLKLCTEPVFSKSKCWEPKPTKASHWSYTMKRKYRWPTIRSQGCRENILCGGAYMSVNDDSPPKCRSSFQNIYLKSLDVSWRQLFKACVLSNLG